MDTNQKKSIIKTLLTGKLTISQRKRIADMDAVNEEIKRQWDEAGEGFEDVSIKSRIWKKIKAKCGHDKNNQVLLGLWQSLAAAVALLLLIGGLWISFRENKVTGNELVEIKAPQSRMYMLPDSTKVWMESGSSIQYVKAFHKDRRVWLSGNSLFEVRKHQGTPFQVYINNALIEVKGTCFLVKQEGAHHSEVTLFEGKIEFQAQSAQQRTVLRPSQKLTYDSKNTQIQIENVVNISWEDGRYRLKDTPVEQLIKIVSEIYQTDIVLKKALGKEALFSGSIRYDETLDDVLEKICFSLNLTKETQDGQIIIR